MNLLIYYIFRAIGFFISLLSYKNIYRLGLLLGFIAFYLHRPFRKKAMTNLAICYGNIYSEEKRKKMARRSFQNLMITCLEFFRLKKSKERMSEIVIMKNNPKVMELLEKGQGVIFLSAHQGNWEIPFLSLTEKFKGVAIGRPIKNRKLYDYVMSVRQMHGGQIIMPKEATKKGLQALKEGNFLGIVGDQAYPQSTYSYPLFGTRAWTAATPALLAYKSNCPIVVGCNRRIKGHYIVSGSDPIWPNLDKPLKEELPRLMDAAMEKLEQNIKNAPEQWMWVHDRFKQQTLDKIKRPFRAAFVLIVLPPNPAPYLEALHTLKEIFTNSFITCFIPEGKEFAIDGITWLKYSHPSELFVRDWRYQLLFDFYDLPSLQRHFQKLGVFKVIKERKETHSLHHYLKDLLLKCPKIVSS